MFARLEELAKKKEVFEKRERTVGFVAMGLQLSLAFIDTLAAPKLLEEDRDLETRK